MKRWIKLILTIALAVSIPVQGFAAISMPACNMSKVSIGAGMAMSLANTNMVIDTTAGMSEAKAYACKNCCVPISSKICSDQKCSICYLSALQLPDTAPLAMPDRLTTEYQDLINQPYQNFPPTLFRPPKLLTA